jgi:hypothetical protein
MFRPTPILVQAAGLAAVALCLQGSRTPTDGKPNKLETPQAIIATILRLEKVLDDAESQHRVAAVERLIADDYRGVSVGGRIIAKHDVLAVVGGLEEASSQATEQEVRVLENAAVYTALVIDRGVDNKTREPYALATRVVDIGRSAAATGSWSTTRPRAWLFSRDQRRTASGFAGKHARYRRVLGLTSKTVRLRLSSCEAIS